MLRQRIVTAVILLAVLAVTMAAPTPWPFMALPCPGHRLCRLGMGAPDTARARRGGPVAVGVLLGIAALCADGLVDGRRALRIRGRSLAGPAVQLDRARSRRCCGSSAAPLRVVRGRS